jgi:hypothetical protein
MVFSKLLTVLIFTNSKTLEIPIGDYYSVSKPCLSLAAGIPKPFKSRGMMNWTLKIFVPFACCVIEAGSDDIGNMYREMLLDQMASGFDYTTREMLQSKLS